MENTLRLKLIPLQDFEDLFNLKNQQVYNYNKNHKNSNIIIKSKGRLYVNVNNIMRRHEFRAKIWNESHIYYHLLTLGFTNLELAEVLSDYSNYKPATWCNFLSTDLWDFTHIDENKILHMTVSHQLWVFHRLSFTILKKVMKRLNKPTNIKYLTKLMYEKVS